MEFNYHRFNTLLLKQNDVGFTQMRAELDYTGLYNKLVTLRAVEMTALTIAYLCEVQRFHEAGKYFTWLV